MLDQATKPAKEQWAEILEQAASGYLGGARDPKQIRSRRRQLDLLEAATRVFARDGIAKAKMADIAAEAGISVSSIYDYYPSKEDLAYESRSVGWRSSMPNSSRRRCRAQPCASVFICS